MVYCCVPYCKSDSLKKIPGISFHEFPSNLDLRNKWLKAISRENFCVNDKSPSSVVCNKHLREEDYTKTPKRKRLLPNTVPSIFENYPSYMQPTSSKKRKSGFQRKEDKKQEKSVKQKRSCIDIDYPKLDENSHTLVSPLAYFVDIMKHRFDRLFHSKGSRNEEVSCMYDVLNWHIFTWKIPNPSLIPHEVDYAVQSPLFYFENASWIIKMYLYGQMQYQTEGWVDFIIERLNSQTSRHVVHCKMYCRDSCNEEFNRKTFTFGFDSQWTYSRVHSFLRSPKSSELHDPLTLVFEFGMRETSVNELHPQSKSFEFTIDTVKRNPEIGDIFQEYSAYKSFGWKINRMPRTPPANNYAPSPTFSFANASWILKVFPHCIENSSEQNFHVVLERLHSDISEQNIMFKIAAFPFEKNLDGSLMFNSSHTQEELFHFSTDRLGKRRISEDLRIEMKIKNVDSERDIGISRPSGVLQNLKKLFLTQEDSDVIIKVKGRSFPAHRLILKAQSPVFAAALQSDMQEKVTGIIDIEDCDPSTFSDFLCFLYCGEVKKLSAENAFSLFTVADKYNVSDLRTMCMDFIKLNLSIDTFYDTIELAMLYPDTKSELVGLLTDFLTKNLQQITATDKWKFFVVQNPELSKELMSKARDEGSCVVSEEK